MVMLLPFKIYSAILNVCNVCCIIVHASIMTKLDNYIRLFLSVF